MSTIEVEQPRIRPLRVAVSWFLSAAAFLFAAWVVPGVHVQGWGSALLAGAVIAVLNAILPPILAALRLPFTLLLPVPDDPIVGATAVHELRLGWRESLQPSAPRPTPVLVRTGVAH